MKWLSASVTLLLLMAFFGDAQGGQRAREPQTSPSPTKRVVQSPLPSPTGHVNDYEHALTDDTREQIEQALVELQKRSKIEFRVALVKTTGSQSISDYSKAVLEGWNVGAGGDGILLLLALDDHQWRLHTTRALARDLTDEKIKDVGALMNPALAREHYGDGVRRGVEAVIRIVAAKRGFAPISIPAPLLPGN